MPEVSGATLLSLFSFMFLIFGLVVIWTAVQLFRHRGEKPDIQDNALVLAVTTVASLLKTRKNPATSSDRVLVPHTGEPADEKRRQPR
jgi:predicted tellurium resistance membrane protein TerC